MDNLGYTLVDFSPPSSVAGNRDHTLKFMEFVRENFSAIVEDLPECCKAYLIASGHSHNPGLMPLLVLWMAAEELERLPDSFEMIDKVDQWCERLTPNEVQEILSTTNAPTWEQLVRAKRYP